MLQLIACSEQPGHSVSHQLKVVRMLVWRGFRVSQLFILVRVFSHQDSKMLEPGLNERVIM